MATLYPFQEQAVAECLKGKHFIISGAGSGKTAMASSLCKEITMNLSLSRVLVITTASKAKTSDWNDEAKLWGGESWYNSLSSFEVVSWHLLRKWWDKNFDKGLKDTYVIFDECLPADTKVITDKGERELADLNVGDKVLSYNHINETTEYKPITRTIKKKSPQKMIRLLLSNGTAIISTDSHPHYTQSGYKKAKDIGVGDTLYELHNLFNTSRMGRYDTEAERKISQNGESVLFNGMPAQRGVKIRERSLETEAGRKMGRNNSLHAMPQANRNENNPKTKIQQFHAHREDILLGRMFQDGDGIRSGKSKDYEERTRVAANLDRTPRTKRGEWALQRASKDVVRQTQQSKQGVGDGTTSTSVKKGGRLPNELQTRYRECLLQNRNRVRWAEPLQLEDTSQRQEEGKEISPVRVESIEILELADIKRLGLYRGSDYVYCIDVEDNHNFFANGILTHNCAKAKAGVSSGMGKTFISMTKATTNWVGLTATPGDTWIEFYPYFTACGLIKNKTEFKRKFVQEMWVGFPKIVGYAHTDVLEKMWASISTAPDTSQMNRELPAQTHKVIEFKKPTLYEHTLKTLVNADGELLDTSGALCAELRRQCFTKDKRQWVSDFVEGVESGVVMFYNFTQTGDLLEEICSKALGSNGRIWRIDGKHHEIPTAETIGKKDVVLCQWQAGAEALNLQFLHYWVSVESTYSYSTAIQARGRIRRIGQQEPQFYYYLKCPNTIEDAIYKALKTKSTFAQDEWCIAQGLNLKGE